MAFPGGGIIRNSVGFGGGNLRDDVLLVQKLLNAVPPPQGGPTPSLAIDGLCGPKTCGAIRQFQTLALGSADSRIDPGQQTEMALLDLLAAIGALNTLLPGIAGAVIPKVPVIGGPGSPVRRQFLARRRRPARRRPAHSAASDPDGLTKSYNSIIIESCIGISRSSRPLHPP